jgi:hypothetical protein
MKIREVYCKRFWPLPRNTWGITLYPFIFYNAKHWNIEDFMRRHEWIHVEQVRRLGWWKFYYRYLKYHAKKGYDANPFEMEAYKRQSEKTQPWERDNG